MQMSQVNALPHNQQSTQQRNKGYYPNLHGWDFSIPPSPKLKLECLLLICIYTNAKPRTLNDGGEDSVKYRNRKKHCFLAAAILLFIGKIIIT